MSTMSREDVRTIISTAEAVAAEHDLPVLTGVAEIAVDLGVARQTVSMWDARRPGNGFPEPIVTLSMGPVYNLGAVREWFARWTRQHEKKVSA
jgi:hypothetical protein